MWFVEFWTEMSWIVILLFCLTIGFAIAEGLIPGFGVCGCMSIMCGTATLVLEGVFTRSLIYVLMMLVLFIIVALILFTVLVASARKGMLKKTPIIETKTAVPVDYGAKDEVKLLVGRVGQVISECKPVGKADFEGKTFTIISREGNISAGKLVFVEEIKDNLVFVKKLKGGENE